jgi:hypothetical protein
VSGIRRLRGLKRIGGMVAARATLVNGVQFRVDEKFEPERGLFRRVPPRKPYAGDGWMGVW